MISLDDSQFMKDMSNLVEYAEGFISGAKAGKPVLMKNLGEKLTITLGEYLDSNARVDPGSLSHMYEWYRNGDKAARLFAIDYTVRGNKLTMNASMTQSSSIRAGSKEPFYNKARIMESGVPVTITPRLANKLVFDVDGKTVFTKNPVTVSHPGGAQAQGGFEKAFDSFFNVYLSQAVLYLTGLSEHLENPEIFKKNLKKGAGRSAGFSSGVEWISKEV